METGNTRIVNKKVKDLQSLHDAMAANISQPEPVPEETPVVEEETLEVTQEEQPIAEGDDSLAVEQNSSEEIVEDSETSEDVDIYNSWSDDSSDSSSNDETEELSGSQKFFSQFVNDIGAENFEDYDSFLDTVKGKFTSGDALKGLPKELVKAIELSRSGADYKSYLRIDNVDYDKISDIDLVANSVQDHFINDGVLDEDALDKYLEGKSDTDIKIQGTEIRNLLKKQKKQAIESLEREANAEKEKAMIAVDKVLSSKNSIKDFILNDGQKQEFRKAVEDDTVLPDLFFTEGSVDYDKLADVYFKSRYFDRIVDILMSQGANKARRKIIDKMSNPERRSASTPVAPKKTGGIKDAQAGWINDLKTKNQKQYN